MWFLVYITIALMVTCLGIIYIGDLMVRYHKIIKYEKYILKQREELKDFIEQYEENICK